MACGLPPVVSGIASNQAGVCDGRSAMMFDCGNSDELATGLIRAMQDEDWRPAATEINHTVVADRTNRNTNLVRLERRLVEVVETAEASR
jgi:hypothetical protein